MFKLIYKYYDHPVSTVLQRLRLYHPPLNYLNDLSEDSSKAIDVRSQEFSCLMKHILIKGTWKRTGVGRLVDLDKWVISLNLFETKNINMLEIGGSDGITTYDTLRYFNKNYGIEIKASIMEMNLTLHCYRKGLLKYYLTNDYNPLLLQIWTIGILLEETNNKEGVIFNPLIKYIKNYLRGVNVSKNFKKYDDIILKNPVVKNSTNIKWLEQSVFEYNQSIENSFDFIRCSNVLNNGYFEPSKITQAFDLLKKYLRPNGLLLISRTVDIPSRVIHTASLWRKSGGKMVHVSDLNGGSEVKNNVSE